MVEFLKFFFDEVFNAHELNFYLVLLGRFDCPFHCDSGAKVTPHRINSHFHLTLLSIFRTLDNLSFSIETTFGTGSVRQLRVATVGTQG